LLLLWVEALRPQTLQCIRGGWSHYTDTNEPVVGFGDNKYEQWTRPKTTTATTTISRGFPTDTPVSSPGKNARKVVTKW
jgi:hypothetical protein